MARGGASTAGTDRPDAAICRRPDSCCCHHEWLEPGDVQPRRLCCFSRPAAGGLALSLRVRTGEVSDQHRKLVGDVRRHSGGSKSRRRMVMCADSPSHTCTALSLVQLRARPRCATIVRWTRPAATPKVLGAAMQRLRPGDEPERAGVSPGAQAGPDDRGPGGVRAHTCTCTCGCPQGKCRCKCPTRAQRAASPKGIAEAIHLRSAAADGMSGRGDLTKSTHTWRRSARSCASQGRTLKVNGAKQVHGSVEMSNATRSGPAYQHRRLPLSERQTRCSADQCDGAGGTV
jgi:hypothetical protein